MAPGARIRKTPWVVRTSPTVGDRYMETFGATAYTDAAQDECWHLKNVPDHHGLRIDLDYPDGGKTGPDLRDAAI
jgi:hypothetical protein